MAFTAAPSAQTYSTQRVSLVQDLDLRPGDSNFTAPISGMINVVPYTVPGKEGEFYGETRLAIRANTVVTGANVLCRGMYVWEKSDGQVYYFVVATDGTTSRVYSSTDNITWTAVTTLANNSIEPVHFTEFINDVNGKSLILLDTFEGYVFISNLAGTKITSADFPTPHAPFPVFMDGYLFVAKYDTGDIYNCNLNDPFTWTAGNFISAEMNPDPIRALVRVDNYILAVGTRSCEYFYDAAIAVGSPLARYEGSTLPFGTSFVHSIASSQNTVMMLANNNDGSMVFKVIEGFKHTEIPAKGVLRGITQMVAATTMNVLTVRAGFLRQEGQLLYFLNTNGSAIGATTGATLVYSTETKKWCLFAMDDPTKPYPAQCSTPATSNSMATWVAGQYNGRVFFGTTNPSTGDPEDNFGAGSNLISESLFIPPQDFGTLNRKMMSRAGISYWAQEPDASTRPRLSWGDSPQGTITTGVAFAGNPNYNDGGFPFVTQLGSFRQRLFSVTSSAAIRHRWYFLEFDINKGQQ